MFGSKRSQVSRPLNGTESVTANLSSYNNNNNNNGKTGESINTSDSISTSSYVANFYTNSTPSSLSFQPHHHHHHQRGQSSIDTNRSSQQQQQVSRRRQQQQLQIRAPMLVPMMIDDELDLIDDQAGLDLRSAEDQHGLDAADDNNNNHIGVYQALGGRHYSYHQHVDWQRYQSQQARLDCVDSTSHQNLDRRHLELARHNRSMFSSIGRRRQQQLEARHQLSHGFFHNTKPASQNSNQHRHLFAYEQPAGQLDELASHSKQESLKWPSNASQKARAAKPNRTSSGDSGGPLVGSTSSSGGGSSSTIADEAARMNQQQARHHMPRRPTSTNSKGARKNHRGGPDPAQAQPLSCCGKLAKLMLFISNLIFWSTGCALCAWGILALVDEHKYNLSQLLVFEPNSRTSLFQLLAWSYITLGCAAVLVGFCGCSAVVKNNRWILGLYIFLILAIFALDLATGLLAMIFQERLVANVRLRLANKLRSDYGVQASFTAAIDYIQTRFECCGLEGHFDYDQSLWRLQRLGGFEATVARTCCHLRNTFDDQAHINPRPVNESMCQSTDVRFHQSYRYRKGCLDDLERLVRQKIWTYTIGCAAVGAIILLSLLFATCFCRSIPSKSSRKGSPSSASQPRSIKENSARLQHFR